MQRHSARFSNPDYVDTLDGLRAAAAFLVLMFHYWQQSWVTMSICVSGYTIDFGNVVSSGFLGVELLFVLSGFCLYYPYAMHPEKRFRPGEFFLKRVARVLPTYFICVIVSAAWQIGRLEPAVLREQFIANMTLTQMMSQSVAWNQLNGVLWSIAIEFQFYLLFPLILWLFRRRPWLILAAAFLIGEGWRFYLREIDYSRIGFLMNQLPGVIDVFVGGMAAAHVAATFRRSLRRRQQRRLAPVFTLAALACAGVWLLCTMYIGSLRYNNVPENLSRLQMNTRKFAAVAFAGTACCSALGSRWLHRLLGNPVTRFFSSISYQVYLWHMWIALRLKDLNIPASDPAAELPMYDERWRFPYMMLCIAVTLAVAVGMTYLAEKPLSRLILRPLQRRPEPAATRAKDARRKGSGAAPASFPTEMTDAGAGKEGTNGQ